MSGTLNTAFFEVYINGRKLDDYRRGMITSVEYTDSANGSDLLTITMNDPDLTILSDTILVEEAKIKFVGGWINGGSTTFNGYISMIDADFPLSGTPTLKIDCMDNSYIMNRKKKKRSWSNTAPSLVAQQIFREYGLKSVVSYTKKEESLSQSDTDIKFLVSLAENQYDTFLCYVEGDTGYFVKKADLPSKETISYRKDDGNLLSFNPVINKYSKQVEVSVSNVDTNTNKTPTTTVTAPPSTPPTSPTNSSSTSTSGSSTSSSNNTNGTSSETSNLYEGKIQWKFESGKWYQYKYTNKRWVKTGVTK